MTELKVRSKKPSLEGRPKLIYRKVALRPDQETWLIEKGQSGIAINEYIRTLIDRQMREEQKQENETKRVAG